MPDATMLNRPRALTPAARRAVLRPSALSVAALLVGGWVALDTRGQPGPKARAGPSVSRVDLGIGAQQYPDQDAIILRWEQHWTLEKDGAVRRREHRWLKLLNSRPIRSEADPRIDFRDGQDELIIHAARTLLPDGQVLPVPDYSFNVAAPDDVAGWPQYADWRETVVSFSGIQDNAVLELDYEIVTQAGVRPWISGDLRLDDEYPVVQRLVTVTVPQGTTLHHRLDGAAQEAGGLQQSSRNGMTTHSLTLTHLSAAPSEPQSLPWPLRCPRLRFSTCPGAAAIVSKVIQCVEQTARPDDAVQAFAEAAIEAETDPSQQVRKVAKKLQDSFNFVDSAKTYRSFECRGAADVLRSNYGSPLESAALLAAVLRALGLETAFEVAFDALAWDPQVPTDDALAGVVVGVSLPDGLIRVHPHKGIVQNPGAWGKLELLSINQAGELQSTYVAARGENQPSEIHVTGKLTIDADAKATGELRLRLTGGFYDPQSLESGDQQEARVKDLVARVLSDFDVTGHSIAALSQEVLRATANVASKKPLKAYGRLHLLSLGAGPALLKEFPLPLERSDRRTAVYLNGRVRETVDLTIELPAEWTPAVLPSALGPVTGTWGAAGLQVDVDAQTVRFRRTIDVTTDTVAPGDFASLRDAVNTLRAASRLQLVCGKPHSD